MDPRRRRVDITSEVADDLKIAHPYLFCDVEPEAREHVADLRETMHAVCRQEWLRTARGEGSEVVPLPVPERVSVPLHSYTEAEIRRELKVAQGSCRDPFSAALRVQLETDLDPGPVRNRRRPSHRVAAITGTIQQAEHIASPCLTNLQVDLGFSI